MSAQIATMTSTAEHPLLRAAIQGDHESLKTALADPDVDVNHCGEEGLTALFYCANYNDGVGCQLLLDAKAAADVKKVSTGNQPIHHAALGGATKSLTVLLGHDPSFVHSTNLWGETALFLAAHSGEKSAVDLLLRAGSDQAVKDRWGKTASESSRDMGLVDLADWMDAWDAKQPVTEADKAPRTTKNPQQPIALSKLIEAPLADEDFLHWMGLEKVILSGKDMFGWAAVHKLASWNKQRCISALSARLQPVDLVMKGADGFTPLHCAADAGSYLAAQTLLRHQHVVNNINMLSNKNKSALDLAMANGDSRIVDLLKSLGAEQGSTSVGGGNSPTEVQKQPTVGRLNMANFQALSLAHGGPRPS